MNSVLDGAPNKIRQSIGYTTILDRTVGGIQPVVNGHILFPLPTLNLPATVFQIPSSFDFLIPAIRILDAFMAANAAAGRGPTLTARLNYLCLFGFASAYCWIAPSGRISGTHDGWNWSQPNRSMLTADQYIWWIQALSTMASMLVPSFDGTGLVQEQQQLFGYSDDVQANAVAAAKEAGDFSGWSAAWSTWWNNRTNDGYVAALVPPTAADLPNGATFLDTTTSQDIAGYPNPRKWTPLSIGGAQKKYLTMNWDSVTSTCLSASDESAIKSAAETAFLGTSAARDTEISNLLTLTQNLTDQQKCIAEFWAGGPNTVTPPGMFIFLWRTFVTAANLSATKGIDGVLLSGLQLAATLFDGSRMTWALKKDNFEARPIQEIRRAFAGSTLTLYDSTQTPGNLWIPFQATNFVTPPFPDFPSGHSTFGQAFAKVMEDWFGSSIPEIGIQSYSTLTIWSPLFSNGLQTNFKSIPVAAGTSEIQPSVVPAVAITLSWNSWQEMADSCGVSRQYGGIHAVSAHIGGQTVANETYTRVKAAWGIQV